MAATKTSTKPSAETAAGAAPDAPAEATASSGSMVKISAPRAYRRAGFAFGPTPIDIDYGALSEEQRTQLIEDTVLVIRPVSTQPIASDPVD